MAATARRFASRRATRRNPALVMVTNPGEQGAVLSERAALQQIARDINQLYVAGMNGDRDVAEQHRLSAASLVVRLLKQLDRNVHANPGGEKLSGHVQAVVYEHVTEGPRAHGFGNADIDLKSRGNALTIIGLHDKTNVEMFGQRDGSVLLKHRDGKRIWGSG